MRSRLILSIAALSLFFLVTTATTARAEKPKLLLFITVDQLRGDMPSRFIDRFTDGGFRRLMQQGVHYTDAHFRHSTTFTACGHATLVTGGNPAEHGLAGNDWYDQQRRAHVYCVEDDRYHILDREPRPHEGTSPRNLTSSTIGDELILATDGKAKVFSVSIKDRGAILPGGHYGKAFWYSGSTGEFVTSNYYYSAYPDWAATFNAAKHGDRYREQSWTLLHKKDTYLYADSDDRPFEKSYKHLGRTFPRKLGHEDDKTYYAALRFTPMGDELTLDFARACLIHEKLGEDDVTDMLAVSLSATDYIGHAFGPNSLEAEDNLLRLDAMLAEFLAFVDKRVGLDNTLVVLSSDHGVDATPEYRHQMTCRPTELGPDFVPRSSTDFLLKKLAKSGLPTLCCGAGRHDPTRFLAAANKALRESLKIDADLVIEFWNPSLYLDLPKVTELGLKVADVEAALAEHMRAVPGIARAVSRTDLLAGRVPGDEIGRKMARAFHPQRTGNVMIVQEASWYLYPEAQKYSAMHGSPYSYDTHVPIMVMGPGLSPRTIRRRVGPEDIAPTVAQWLAVTAPSASTGDVLSEAAPPNLLLKALGEGD